jgi:hypothetical protein
VLAAAGRTLVTLVLGLGVPAGLGALRAVLSGELCGWEQYARDGRSPVPITGQPHWHPPIAGEGSSSKDVLPTRACSASHTLLLPAGTAMVWFAHPVLGFAMYFPVAVGMLLLPWGGQDYSTPKGLQLLPYHTLGAALFNSAVAAALTQIGAGTAMIFAMWGGAGLLIALCLTQVRVCDTAAVMCVGGRTDTRMVPQLRQMRLQRHRRRRHAVTRSNVCILGVCCVITGGDLCKYTGLPGISGAAYLRLVGCAGWSLCAIHFCCLLACALLAVPDAPFLLFALTLLTMTATPHSCD